MANVDELFNSLTDTNIALANVTNEFMNLHHTQFIENRVYEEDEIVASEVPEIVIMYRYKFILYIIIKLFYFLNNIFPTAKCFNLSDNY